MKKHLSLLLTLALFASCHTKDTCVTKLHTFENIESLIHSHFRLSILDSITKDSGLTIDSILITPAVIDSATHQSVITLYNIRKTEKTTRQKSSSANSTDTIRINRTQQNHSSTKKDTTASVATPKHLILSLFTIFLFLLSIRWLIKKIGSENKKT